MDDQWVSCIIWYLIGVLIFAAIGGLINQSKNRSPRDGALLGGLLGIIGILILVCQSKIKPADDTEKKEDKTERFNIKP